MLFGSALAAVAAAAIVLAARPASGVSRTLELVATPSMARGTRRRSRGADLRHARVPLDAGQLLVVRVASGLAIALLAALVSLFLPIGPLLVVAGAYGGFVVPALAIARRAARERRAAEVATAILVERLEALVAAGRPPEAALVLLMARPSGAAILDDALRRTHEAYSLGAPVFRTLAAHAREEGLDTCARLAEDLERSRDLGSAAVPAIRELRMALRTAERARSLAAASEVEGKLMLVLVLCYLPALILLVVIPLFIALLEGLFG